MRQDEITVNVASVIAGVTKQAIYQWIKQGKLQGITRNHFSSIYLNKEKFEKWVQDNTQ